MRTSARINPALIYILAIELGIVLGILVWQNPHRGQTLLSVLTILTAWPVVVGALGFSAGIVFKKELSGFIDRIHKVKYPGGELEARQQPIPMGEGYEKEINKTIDAEVQAEKSLNKLLEENEEIYKSLHDYTVSLTEEAERWKYKYFDTFFLDITKAFLRNVYKSAGDEKGSFVFANLYPIDDSCDKERILLGSVVEAIKYYSLINIDDSGLVMLTERGVEYCKHLEETGQPKRGFSAAYSRGFKKLSFEKQQHPSESK